VGTLSGAGEKGLHSRRSTFEPSGNMHPKKCWGSPRFEGPLSLQITGCECHYFQPTRSEQEQEAKTKELSRAGQRLWIKVTLLGFDYTFSQKRHQVSFWLSFFAAEARGMLKKGFQLLHEQGRKSQQQQDLLCHHQRRDSSAMPLHLQD